MSTELNAEELRDILRGFADVFREMVPWHDEADYRRRMVAAPCHLGICSIDECAHCSRMLAAHAALAKLREILEPTNEEQHT